MDIWAGIYDALGALQATQLGYDGLWLSSLGLSVARLGLPDAGFLPWTTTLTAVREIAPVASIPLVVDFENGYGLSSRELSVTGDAFFDAGASALCVEDTSGPKRNSMWAGTRRTVMGLDDMVARLSVLHESARHSGGALYARTEVLIEGCSVRDAADRVLRYAEAGCDGVVVHFRTNVEDVLSVARLARGSTKLIVIPTAAPELSFPDFQDAGFSVYVAANVALRSAATAMRSSLQRVLSDKRQLPVLEDIATLEDLDLLVDTAHIVKDFLQ